MEFTLEKFSSSSSDDVKKPRKVFIFGLTASMRDGLRAKCRSKSVNGMSGLPDRDGWPEDDTDDDI